MSAAKEKKTVDNQKLVNKFAGLSCNVCGSMRVEPSHTFRGRQYVKCKSCYAEFLARLWPTASCVMTVKKRDVGKIWRQMIKWVRFDVWHGDRNLVEKRGLTKDAKEKLSELFDFILDNCLDMEIEDVGMKSIEYIFGFGTAELTEKQREKLDKFGKKFRAIECHDPRYIQIEKRFV